jgi:hypothetical protein
MRFAMREAVQTIQLLVAPVVMVSACGLLCLALYNRLAAVVGRLRAMAKEEVDTLARLSLAGAEPGKKTPERRLRARVTTLEEQVDHVMSRARLIRAALTCLLSAVLCMLVCSLALGLSVVARAFATVALGAFFAGVLVMIAGVILALGELRIALVPAALEHEAVEPPEAG